MIYTAVAAGSTRLHTVTCRAGSIQFDGGDVLPWPTLGLFVRAAAFGSRVLAVAKGAEGDLGGRLIVGNETGAWRDISETYGNACVAIEPVGLGWFRVAAVISGDLWRTWLVSDDLSSVAVESTQPNAVVPLATGWTDFADGVPTLAAFTYNVLVGSILLGMPKRRGRWTAGGSNRANGVDAYDHLTGNVYRVSDIDTPVQIDIATLPDGSALVAISADTPAFIPSERFDVMWAAPVHVQTFAPHNFAVGVIDEPGGPNLTGIDSRTGEPWPIDSQTRGVLCTVDKDTPAQLMKAAGLAKRIGQPLYALWDRADTYVRVPDLGVDTIPLVECYRMAGEPIARAASRWLASVLTLQAAGHRVALCLQAYRGERGDGSMTFTEPEIIEAIEAAADIARVHHIVAVWCFAYDRHDGIKNNPGIREAIARLRAASADCGAFPALRRPVPVVPPVLTRSHRQEMLMKLGNTGALVLKASRFQPYAEWPTTHVVYPLGDGTFLSPDEQGNHREGKTSPLSGEAFTYTKGADTCVHDFGAFSRVFLVDPKA